MKTVAFLGVFFLAACCGLYIELEHTDPNQSHLGGNCEVTCMETMSDLEEQYLYAMSISKLRGDKKRNSLVAAQDTLVVVSDSGIDHLDHSIAKIIGGSLTTTLAWLKLSLPSPSDCDEQYVCEIISWDTDSRVQRDRVFTKTSKEEMEDNSNQRRSEEATEEEEEREESDDESSQEDAMEDNSNQRRSEEAPEQEEEREEGDDESSQEGAMEDNSKQRRSEEASEEEEEREESDNELRPESAVDKEEDRSELGKLKEVVDGLLSVTSKIADEMSLVREIANRTAVLEKKLEMMR